MVDVTTARASMVPGAGRAGGVTARQTSPCPADEFCAKQLELESVTVPSGDVAPGAETPVTVALLNHAQAITSFDPDLCQIAGTPCKKSGVTNGYCTRIVVDPEWTSTQTQLFCSNFAIPPPNRATVDVPVPAPDQEGDLDVNVHVELTGSGERTATIVDTISYKEGGSQNPRTPRDDDSNGDGVPSIIQQVALLAFLLIVASAAASG